MKTYQTWELGIRTDRVIVDLGCPSGHDTLPAARVVGSQDKVPAIEREQKAIDQ